MTASDAGTSDPQHDSVFRATDSSYQMLGTANVPGSLRNLKPDVKIYTLPNDEQV